MGAFNLQTCARPNILKLVPYRCARDDYKDDGTNILLDANENCYGPSLSLSSCGSGLSNGSPTLEKQRANDKERGENTDIENMTSMLLRLNRYPDPHQIELKAKFCDLRNQEAAAVDNCNNTSNSTNKKPLTPENLFLGVGSDEAIDALLRCFCRPGKDKILTCPPTYGMYSVSAQVNDVEVVKVDLELEPELGKEEERFQLRTEAIYKRLDEENAVDIKIVYLCSPGNPTGKLIRKTDVEKILQHPTWNGIVVIDEAYIDFAKPGSSMAPLVTQWPNLAVMQTLSKAFGLAGIRLGAAFTSPEIAQLLNNLKAPYSISSPTSVLASSALSIDGLQVQRKNVEAILKQRGRLLEEIPKIQGVGRLLGGTDSNFLLYEILSKPGEKGGKPCNVLAQRLYEGLAEKRGVVVRFRGKEAGCLGCLRITVGTEAENTRLLGEIRNLLEEFYAEGN